MVTSLDYVTIDPSGAYFGYMKLKSYSDYMESVKYEINDQVSKGEIPNRVDIYNSVTILNSKNMPQSVKNLASYLQLKDIYTHNFLQNNREKVNHELLCSGYIRYNKYRILEASPLNTILTKVLTAFDKGESLAVTMGDCYFSPYEWLNFLIAKKKPIESPTSSFILKAMEDHLSLLKFHSIKESHITPEYFDTFIERVKFDDFSYSSPYLPHLMKCRGLLESLETI